MNAMVNNIPEIIFYLYFQDQADGEGCKVAMENKGFTTYGFDILETPNKKTWSLRLALEKKISKNDLDSLERMLNEEVPKFKGEYDGYDRSV